ncbi:hypothetical protein VPH35_119437 [Triticum aestivum]
MVIIVSGSRRPACVLRRRTGFHPGAASEMHGDTGYVEAVQGFFPLHVRERRICYVSFHTWFRVWSCMPFFLSCDSCSAGADAGTARADLYGGLRLRSDVETAETRTTRRISGLEDLTQEGISVFVRSTLE